MLERLQGTLTGLYRAEQFLIKESLCENQTKEEDCSERFTLEWGHMGNALTMAV